MRILHVLDHSLPLQSGYVFRTLGILGAQRGFGWETIQLTSPRQHATRQAVETVDGWTFHRTPRPAGPLAGRPVVRELLEMRATAARLHELIGALRPDILHAHSPVLNGLPALWAARRARLPLVYEVRALWEDAAVDLGHARTGNLRYRTTRALETWLLRRADAVVTLCQAMRAEIVGRGVAPGRIAVVPNAIDPADFPATAVRDPSLVDSLGLAGRRVLGFIGSFYHYEGLDLLLAALPQIRAALPQAALLLVGGGPEEARLQRLAGELGLGDAVRFTGRVPHGQVRRYYDLVDFFVYPRRSIRLTELVTPLKPLEAMAEGRIVLASDIGGHRELIRDNQTGFLFPPDDPPAMAARVIAAMLATDRHPPMRAAARCFVETERTWPVCVQACRPLYERLIAR
jgi:PEP-CTERM/exosortase A-associated glycosyltransferase